ncbi:cation channel sperm-associated protein subunit gamma-like [Puntigrus tetrazona]|uniref:cation channel sperm-associated protein subunit gamma-like n=1 Tax=Puntigrus tetrazona TaxID=1606681 RepID=UPI001C898C57|nr:cation channel sperm-associated protein subunit gamma-like [Puntigrus tetrazona]
MALIVIVLLALSVLGFKPSRAGECEWVMRLCKTDLVSTGLCGVRTGGMEVQDLDHTEMHKNVGFPYYLKLDLLCGFKESSERVVLEDLMTGLTPKAVVMFQEPTHPTHFKPQRLEVELSVVSLSENATCGSEMCECSWYAPMPFINGSVVQRVKVKSIEMGPQHLPEKSFAFNVNGYMVTTQKRESEAYFGTEIRVIEDSLRVGSPSFPLWAVVDHAPVLLLPGIPGLKTVLMTATEFQDTSLIEVSIKSSSGSLECLQVESSMIQETFSTESSLFVVYNQELYRFLGNYSLLPLSAPPSDTWEKVLSAVCVSGLVPVSIPHHGREYFYVLGGGLQIGTLYRAELYDGFVTFTELVDSLGFTPCKFSSSPDFSCQVRSAAQNAQTDITDIVLIELLFREDQERSYILLTFDGDFQMSEILPQFIAYGQKQRQQKRSSLNLKFSGMTLSPSTGILYIWGNSLIFSYILAYSFWQDSGFPSDQMIKYFTLSYDGTFVFVTENEELWWGQERTDSVFRLRPSQGWNELSHLQPLSGDHSTLTVFYDGDKELQEVLYTVGLDGKGCIVKRKIPVVEILSFSQLSFLSSCPFDLEYSVPHTERFNRLQRYSVNPQLVTTSSELHTTRLLALYQGFVYHLLQLHAQYLMVIGDPKENPIWRMCNSVLYKDLCLYLSYNNVSGVTTDSKELMTARLPDRVYLDRTASFSFSLFIRAHQLTLESIGERAVNDIRMFATVPNSKYLRVTLQRYVKFNYGGVLYKVTVADKGMVEDQLFPGERLLHFSVLFRIGISPRQCFQQTDLGMVLSGLQNLPVYIGCPPGNRLVFDASSTLQEGIRLNRRNFSCLNPDPVTPCFYYKNLFFPFLLIQDVVLGESRKFLGSYTLKVVGGGPHSRKNIHLYSPGEVLRYNSLNYRSEKSLIWDINACEKDGTSCNVTEEGFFIFNGSRNNGIRWLCQPNSPCADVVSNNPAVSPRFFFIFEVSNRDTGTYCSHTFRFDILVHDFPMSSSRRFYVILLGENSRARRDLQVQTIETDKLVGRYTTPQLYRSQPSRSQIPRVECALTPSLSKKPEDS